MNGKSKVSLQSGVTLIELLIVIAVVGVLSAALISVINPVKQLQRARDTQRKADIAQIRQALELYRADHDQYPASTSVSCGSTLTSAAGDITYLQKVPCDARQSTTSYTYVLDSTSVGYTIRACLEVTDDKDKDATDSCTGDPVSLTRSNP